MAVEFLIAERTQKTSDLLYSGVAERWSAGYIKLLNLLKTDIDTVLHSTDFKTHALEKRKRHPELEGYYSSRLLPNSGFRFIWWHFIANDYDCYEDFVRHIAEKTGYSEAEVIESFPDLSSDVIYIYSAAGNYHPESTPAVPTKKKHSHYEFYDWWQEYLENRELEDSAPYHVLASRLGVEL